MAYWLSIMGLGSLGLSTRTISHEHCPMEVNAAEAEEALALNLDWVIITESDEPPYTPGWSVEASNGPMSLADFGHVPEEVTEEKVEEEAPSPEPDPADFPCTVEGCDAQPYPSQAALDFHVQNTHTDAPATEEPAAEAEAPAVEEAEAGADPADDVTPPDAPVEETTPAEETETK